MSALTAFNSQFVSLSQQYALAQVNEITEALKQAGVRNTFTAAAAKDSTGLDCVTVKSYTTDGVFFREGSSSVATQGYLSTEYLEGPTRELDHSEIDANILHAFDWILGREERAAYQRYLSSHPQP